METDEEMAEIPSTHAMPLSMLTRYLARKTGARVLILGVQPKRLAFSLGDTSLSEEVRSAVDRLVKLLCEILSPKGETIATRVS